MSACTRFYDMHSGGGQTTPYNYVYIEAPKREAVSVFISRFGKNPHAVRCNCCGPNMDVTEFGSIEDATAFERKCTWVEPEGPNVRGRWLNDGIPINELESWPDAKIIRASEIGADERAAHHPSHGLCDWEDDIGRMMFVEYGEARW